MEKASNPVGAGASGAAGARCRAMRAEGAPARGSPRTVKKRAVEVSRKTPARAATTGGFFSTATRGFRLGLARGAGGAPAAAARADWRLANMDTGRNPSPPCCHAPG